MVLRLSLLLFSAADMLTTPNENNAAIMIISLFILLIIRGRPRAPPQIYYKFTILKSDKDKHKISEHKTYDTEDDTDCRQLLGCYHTGRSGKGIRRCRYRETHRY